MANLRGSIIYPNHHFDAATALRVSTAGFQTQWLFSEWAFAELSEPERMLLQEQHYVGLISAHLAISYAYLLALKDEPTSDIYATAASTGRSRNALVAFALLPAALDTYRLLGSDVPMWVRHISIGLKAGAIGLIWTF